MKTINFSLIILVFSIFTSCSENESEYSLNLPYFQFQNEDVPSLLNLPELNSRITFINQDNEEIHFDIIKSESKKQLHSTGSWVYGSIKYFYYDEQTIHFKSPLFLNDFHKYVGISVKRWPKEFNDGRNGKPRILSKSSNLITNFRYISFNNKNQNAFVEYKNLFSMNINNIEYKKVIKIDLTNTESITNNWSLPSLNYIYFDINEGFIGFDDRDGKEWRLK